MRQTADRYRHRARLRLVHKLLQRSNRRIGPNPYRHRLRQGLLDIDDVRADLDVRRLQGQHDDLRTEVREQQVVRIRLLPQVELISHLTSRTRIELELEIRIEALAPRIREKSRITVCAATFAGGDSDHDVARWKLLRECGARQRKSGEGGTTGHQCAPPCYAGASAHLFPPTSGNFALHSNSVYQYRVK